MNNVDSEVSKKYKPSKILRIANLIGALIFGMLMSIKGIEHIGMLFLITIYFWIYILFLFTEIRFIVRTKTNIFSYLTKNLIVLIGFLFPLWIFIPFLLAV